MLNEGIGYLCLASFGEACARSCAMLPWVWFIAGPWRAQSAALADLSSPEEAPASSASVDLT